MTRVFVSYRHADSQMTVDRIYGQLVDTFGQSNIFMDADDLRPEVDVHSAIRTEIQRADAVVFIIGPQWARFYEQRRGDRNDFVRIALKEALQQRKITIPVLIDGAAFPDKYTFAPNIEAVFPYLDTITIGSGPDFQPYMDQLISVLENLDAQTPPPPLPENTERELPWLVRFVLALAFIAALVIFVLWVLDPVISFP